MQRYLDDWLKSYLQYTAYSEAPEIMHFWTGVGTIAGALRRKVYIDQEYFIWSPNFYIVFVAPAGIVTKSTTANIGANLLREVGGIKFGPDAITWPALTQALAASLEMVQMPDSTFMPMSCLTFISSELGTLLDPRDRKMVDVLVDLWDGRPGVWEKTTKTQGTDVIQNPWLNIIACTTPIWLADNLPRAMIGGGFTSRCVFIYAEKKSHLVPYPKEEITTEARDLRAPLIHDLEVLSTIKGEYTIHPEAIEVGKVWYAEHWRRPPAALSGDRQYGGYIARKQTMVHKLAMVLEASRSNSPVIMPDSLEKAIRIMTATEKDLPLVFRNLNATEETDRSERILDYVRESGPTPTQALYRLCFEKAGMPIKEYTEALNSLTAAGLVATQQRGMDIYIVPISGELPAGSLDTVPERFSA